MGMGATLLDGVVVERHGMVAAGSLVRQNTRIPSGEVYWQELSHLHNFKDEWSYLVLTYCEKNCDLYIYDEKVS